MLALDKFRYDYSVLIRCSDDFLETWNIVRHYAGDYMPMDKILRILIRCVDKTNGKCFAA